MTTTHFQLDPARQQRLESLCRQHGVPVTHQRRVVFEALSRRQDHPTADQLHADVKAAVPGLSRTSIYRILEALVALGAARKIAHPGAHTRFDPKVHQHHHLICQRCHTIRDLEDARLDGLELPRPRGFRITDYAVTFRGLCTPCARSAGQAASPGSALPNKKKQRSHP